MLNNLERQSKQYLLATLHQTANTNNSETLNTVLAILMQIGQPSISTHSLTRTMIQHLDRSDKPIKLIETVGYLD